MLVSLSEPASYTQQVDGEITEPRTWWLGSGARMTSERLPDEELARWLGSSNIEELASFAPSRIEALYRQVALAAGKEPVFFAEKCLPRDNVPQLLWELYPEGRELFLVRDFRDMVASVFAYNAKRRTRAFGTQDVDTDEQYVRRMLAPSVQDLLDEWRRRAGRAHLVRYEDLVLNPVRVLAEVLTSAGLDDSPQVIAQMIDEAGEEIPQMDHHRTAASARASVGRWRELPDELRHACDEAFGPALEEFGYAL
jgi:hypothetical protein